jgi:Metallo-peptidase family M12B Reprolysin-like
MLPKAVAHEIMHALGLEHTFVETGIIKTHTFEAGKTKNYMDYNNTKVTTFFWQWRLLH